MRGSDEIKLITDLLDELKKNYYDVIKMLDELADDSLETELCEEYKRVIDAIRGIKKYE